MKFTDSLLKELSALKTSQDVRALAEKYNVTPKTIYVWRRKVSELVTSNDASEVANKEPLETYKLESKIHRLELENKELKRHLNSVKSHVVDSSDIRDLIQGLSQVQFDNTIPEWVESTKSNTLVPVIALSDIHMGEVLKPGEIGFGDEYNSELAHKFADYVTEDFIGICKVNMSTYQYPGVVLLLGGDGITGALHDLSETNDRTPITQVVEITNLYIRIINALKAAFGKVAIFAVTGNHGRLDARAHTKTKGRVDNSLETIAYHFTQKHFEYDDSISFIISESDEILFSINNRKFNLQHGDTIKGGGGIGGIHVPIMRARAKKLSAAVANAKAFDTLIIGHFHQHFVSDELIILNSLKPYDEYSKMMNFTYTRPGATSFFVNAHGDIIFATDIKIRKDNTTPNITKSIDLF